eukprot:GDKJ01021923.1.p1 GENE.GDKJ01021923.1~~GDKJ01021923.1.p1  ORF type:complete len:608 (+),score=124.83 GDKJ01021923.1:40-1863(+)
MLDGLLNETVVDFVSRFFTLICPLVFFLPYIRWTPFTWIWLLFTFCANVSGNNHFLGVSVTMSIALNAGWYFSQLRFQHVWPSIMNAYLEDMPFAKNILPFAIRFGDILMHLMPCIFNLYYNIHHVEWYHGIVAFIVPRFYMTSLEGHMFGTSFTNLNNMYDTRPYFTRVHLLSCFYIEHMSAFVVLLGVFPWYVSHPLRFFFFSKMVLDLATGDSEGNLVVSLLRTTPFVKLREIEQKLLDDSAYFLFTFLPNFLLEDCLRAPTAACAWTTLRLAWQADLNFFHSQHTPKEIKAVEEIEKVLQSSLRTLCKEEQKRKSILFRQSVLNVMAPSSSLSSTAQHSLPPHASVSLPSVLKRNPLHLNNLLATITAQAQIALTSNPSVCPDMQLLARSSTPLPYNPPKSRSALVSHQKLAVSREKDLVPSSPLASDENELLSGQVGPSSDVILSYQASTSASYSAKHTLNFESNNLKNSHKPFANLSSSYSSLTRTSSNQDDESPLDGNPMDIRDVESSLGVGQKEEEKQELVSAAGEPFTSSLQAVSARLSSRKTSPTPSAALSPLLKQELLRVSRLPPITDERRTSRRTGGTPSRFLTSHLCETVPPFF